MDLLKPSYASGYAKNASQSAHPNLWKGLVGAWMPSLGVTGKYLYDLSQRDIEGRYALGNGNVHNFDPATSWVVSNSKQGINLNGTNQNIRNIVEMKREAFTIEVEFEWDDFNTNNVQFLTAGTLERLEIHLGGIGTNGVRFIPYRPYGYGMLDVQNAVTSGINHFVFTANHGETSKFYKNGSLNSESSAVGSSNSILGQRFFYIGSRLNAQYHLDGKIFNAKIWNRVLKPSEIKQLYLNPAAPFQKKATTVVSVPAAIPTATKVGSIKKPTTIIKPSYQAGYARNASESENTNLWDGLVGAWMPSLGVTGDTLKDVSGNGNHGTLTNMDAATDWVATSKGLALGFDGTDDHVVIPTFGRDLTSQATVSCIFRPVVVDSTWRKAIIQPYSTSWSNPYYRWQIGTYQNRLFCGFNVNNNYFTGHLPDTDIASSGNVYHVVGTFKNGVIRLFVNGISKNQADKSSIATTIISGVTDEVCIGRDASYFNQERLNGNVYQASIYNRALSPQEIKQLYVDSLAPFRKKQRVSVAVPAAVTPSATYHPLRSLAHPLEQ